MNRISFKLSASMFLAAILGLLSVVAVAAQATGAASPHDAVEALVRPLAEAVPGQPNCNALSGVLSDCPITARLRDRLEHPQAGVENGNLVGRTQQPPTTLDVAQVKLPAGATTASVNTRWVYGSDAQAFEYTITFVVKKEAGGWLVDDSYCANNPASSIYNAPTGPCPSSSVPGMPATGAEGEDNTTLGIVLAALLLVWLGLTLRLRQASAE